MKITKSYLKQIIREELEAAIQTEVFTKGQKVIVKKSGKQQKDQQGTIEDLPVENPKGENDPLRHPLVKIKGNKMRIDPKNFVDSDE